MSELKNIVFQNFKAFERFTFTLRHMNVLVGPNNAGKSTIIGALRILQEALKTARSKSSTLCANGRYGYPVNVSDLSISLENVHTDLSDDDSTVTYTFADDNKLVLEFPQTGGAFLIAEGFEYRVLSPRQFRATFPFTLHVVPVLGPVEHNEKIVTEETVRRNLTSHRASRHFRQAWLNDPSGFERFRALLRRTWVDMDVEPSEQNGSQIHMFVREAHSLRELYWAGFGFQVWCQVLTHIVRASGSALFVLDEADIYLHPDLQRTLLTLLRELECDVVVATHSSEIVSEADTDEVVLINKRLHSARRLRSPEDVQGVLASIGSAHNVTLAHIAKAKHVLFVEGKDVRLVRALARKAGYHSIADSSELAFVPISGFSNWQRVVHVRWVLEQAFGNEIAERIRWGLLLDRDYYCSDDVESIKAGVAAQLGFCWIHEVKEIENYCLVPAAISRLVTARLKSRNDNGSGQEVPPGEIEKMLLQLTKQFRKETSTQLAAKFLEHHEKVSPRQNKATHLAKASEVFEEAWGLPTARFRIVPGKKLLAALNGALQAKYGISVSTLAIANALRKDEMSEPAREMLAALDEFATTVTARTDGEV